MEAVARILAAQHAVQSGVAIEMQEGLESGTDPKHLRVGVNSALVFEQAIARLLIQKGVVTEEEYATACAEAMEQEKLRYEKRLQDHFKNPGIRLG